MLFLAASWCYFKQFDVSASSVVILLKSWLNC